MVRRVYFNKKERGIKTVLVQNKSREGKNNINEKY